MTNVSSIPTAKKNSQITFGSVVASVIVLMLTAPACALVAGFSWQAFRWGAGW